VKNDSTYSIEQPTPDLPPPIGPGPSPLLPQHLIDVFLHPRLFFSSQLALGQAPYVILVTWCFGVADAVNSTDRAALFGTGLGTSWTAFWIFCLVTGAVTGLLLWLIGGWWYHVRLSWAGHSGPDRKLARLVYIYSSFVESAPTVILALLQTLLYPSPQTAWQAQGSLYWFMVVFPFWSIITSYTAVQVVFGLSGWRPKVWFLILPVLVYALLFGVIAAIMGFVVAPGQTANWI
jgi:hypothetical protein